ncbi:DUF1993 domain-containing protein [Altererythrobacter sp. RZ02]|uniref:DUF1993 domain-containing protein n=1 Tax=Pontixanthobacter rizhaonensis TaxID=2730337 RepID=A0A848QU66_9SPHN|nr:DUF1993 domain-containing protein [Pontixanthobacter rizhaonensis]NMW32628.1 DUF1993 domain-containing protein [Pontixanthobacter rizhaonensis]
MTLFESTLPIYRRSLTTLSAMLTKAQAHEGGDALLDAKLADDMHPLATQLRFLSNQPGEAVARLTDRTFTSRDDNETTLASAKAVLAEMDGFLAGVEENELVDAHSTIVMDIPNGMQFTLTAEQYVRDWSLPNFYFHLTTAYAILRQAGVPLGKADFVPHMMPYITKMPTE